ncbi:hypothetical protein KG091_08570 [Carnobacteriaceae bacterium zg-ZUI78]|nr:hypothetical protein [Carnobacteriaceae bacterium zg-ZUI78]
MKKDVFYKSKLKKIETHYQQNNEKKYCFIGYDVITKEEEKKIIDILDEKCDYFIISIWNNDTELFDFLVKQLSEYILQIGYIKNSVLYNSHKQIALKCRYSRYVLMHIKQSFNSDRYFPSFHEYIDCSYYKDDLCLLTQIGENQGLYRLKNMEI